MLAQRWIQLSRQRSPDLKGTRSCPGLTLQDVEQNLDSTIVRTLFSQLFARRGKHNAPTMQFADTIRLFQVLHPSFGIISGDALPR